MVVPNNNQDIPELTAKVAHASFPNGNPYITLRDELGPIFQDEDFIDLYSNTGQPALSPWRLALITIIQFRENLSDRKMAEAIRARIDLKYLLSLDLDYSGFNFSVLSEFRSRLLKSPDEILLNKFLECCRAKGLIKERGQQRTDATHVLASIRVMSRLELVAETLRATLNKIAEVDPIWLKEITPADWYKRYGQRIDNFRLPDSKTKREEFAQTVGEDGLKLLNLAAQKSNLCNLREITILRQVWKRHYEFQEPADDEDHKPDSKIRFLTNKELDVAGTAIESPYDTDARFRSRYDKSWTGYIVHLTETCESDLPHLITHVETTLASVHESKKVREIHQSLADKNLLPEKHFVDSAYIDAKLLVDMRDEHGVDLFGPAITNQSWQSKIDEAYDLEKFKIDWKSQVVECPEGKKSINWRETKDSSNNARIAVRFSSSDCRKCEARHLCTRSSRRREVGFRPKKQFEALQAMRQKYESIEGREEYKKRAGIEGTISQGFRSFGLRKTRYRGITKTSLQHVATATALNFDRLVAWINEVPLAKTRTSRFVALAPSLV